MTIQDFVNYYKNGHGKAVYALQSIADKKPYRKAFLECLKEQDCFYEKGGYIIALAKILINDEAKNEFIGILLNRYKSIDFIAIEIINVLSEFMPCEEVVSLIELEEEYEKAYNNYLQPTSKADERNISGRYMALARTVDKIYGGNDQRLKALIKDAARIYESKKQLRPNILWYLKRKHSDNYDRFTKLFNEALNGHPLQEELRSIIDYDFSEPQRREYKTVEDYLKGANDDYHHAKNSFSEEDAEIVKKVAEIAIDQNAEHRVSALTLFLDESKYLEGVEQCKHRPFPLESKYLEGVIEKYKHLYSTSLEIPLDGCWAFVALSVLKNIKGSAAKEYCISIMKDETLCERMRCDAIETFDINYEPSDAEKLKEHYKFCNYSVLSLLLRFANRGIKDAPYELCFDAYENAASWDRNLAVTALAKLGMLTPEMINECFYDENKAVREIAIAEKKQIT